MADIKLFVCCHQPAAVPEHPLLVPIQVGAALADAHLSGFLHDDAGENISHKNRSYCELTAQYWAWKNVEADYYGFFHYRRYLYPDLKAKCPYCIAREPSAELLDEMGYDQFAELIEKYDLILPKSENMYITVREHYSNAPFHHMEDLERTGQIVRLRYPEYGPAVEEYLSGARCLFGNIYIMKKWLFQDYCGWLFPVLEEFDQQADTSRYTPQERRVDGYLAERLLGIFAAYHRELKRLELPRVHFIENLGELYKRRAINFFLPPGSLRRSRIKSLKR